jgi:hypothetical protein
MGSQIYFTTNPGEYDDLEGVIISEQNPPGFVVGADRTVVGITDVTLKGPVDTGVVVTSQEEFEAIFGHRSRFTDTTLVNQIWLAMARKPFAPQVVVVRAAAAGAVTGTLTLSNVTPTAILRVDASSPGAWAGDVTAAVVAASDADANKFDLVVAYRGGSTTYKNLNLQTGFNNIADVVPTDNTVLVTLTKLADGRPLNSAAAALASGADGTIADSDFTAANRAMAVLDNYPGISFCIVANRATSAVKGNILTLASAGVDRMWGMWNGSHTADRAAVVTDAASYRSDRIVYCWNSPKIADPETEVLTEVPPHHFMASIFAQSDVDWHVSSKRTFKQTVAIKSLHFAPTRGDLILLKNAGICALEQRKAGYAFRSGVTTSITPGLTEIARRRQADFLQLSVAERLADFVAEADTTANSNAIVGEIDAFSATYRDQERIVKDYSIIGQATNAQGVKVLRWRVALIRHMLHLVLETEIGTGVTIVVDAVA